MTPGAGGTAGADVLIVAEQLRRQVPGGIGTYVRGLLTGLGELGVDERPGIAVLASRVKGTDPLSRYGFPIREIALPGPLVAPAWSRGIARVRDVSLVHATSFALPPTRAPLVVMVHDLAFLHHPEAYPARGLRWHRRALQVALSRAVAFIVPAVRVKEELCASGAMPEAVHVIEEGADHLPAPDDAGTAALLTRLGVSSPFLLSVGTLEPRKNLERVIAAYQRVRSAMPEPWPLVIVGPNGWGSAGIRATEGVLLAGAVEDGVMSGLYSSAELLCYAPIEEGFGLPVVEAMRAGTPVVSSDVPSADRKSQLVDPRSVASIAEGILEVVRDRGRRDDLVTAGSVRAAVLTWRDVARQHVAVWRLATGARS